MLSFVTRRRHRILVAALIGFYVALFVSQMALTISNGAAAGHDVQPLDFSLGLAFSAIPLTGAVILWHQAGNQIGRLLVAIGTGVALGAVSVSWAEFVFRSERAGLPGGAVAAWLACWVSVPALGLGPWLFAMFPSGTIETRWLRTAASVAGVGLAMATLAQAFIPGPISGTSEGTSPIMNPFGIDRLEPAFAVMTAIGLVAVVAFVLAAVVDLVIRYRRSRRELRQQMRWMALATPLLPISLVLGVLAGDPVGMWILMVGQIGFLLGVAGGIGVAVLKYRLYDIDLFVRRSLVFAVLSLAIVLSYLGIVALTGSVLAGSADLGPSLVAVGVVAIAFDPVRRRLQAGVDRLVYGRRAEPYAVLSALGQRVALAVAPDDILQTIVETIGDELALNPVAIVTEDNALLAGVRPQSDPDVAGRTESFSVVHQGAVKGSLVVGTRSPQEPLTDPERRLLADLARQAGAAVHAQELATALQRSREETVASREEDRRRIRRELHDGLGPALAAMVLRVDLVADASHENPAVLADLAVLKDQLRSATEEVRRVVTGLRPPALDELGLVAALRAQAEALANPDGRHPLTIEVQAPEELPPLPAAVEVAVLRVASEAITNVVRHAQATVCDVRLEVGNQVDLRVADDGIGMSKGTTAGIGLRSMRERAAEMGGTLELSTHLSGGSEIHLSIPRTVPA